MLKDKFRYGVCLLLIAPLGVAVDTSSDSSITTFRVMGGGGSYASIIRDCYGNPVEKHRYRYKDLGGEVKHRFRVPAELGVRGAYVFDDQPRFNFSDSTASEHYYYINPFVGYEGRVVGLGAGVLISPQREVTKSSNNSVWEDAKFSQGKPVLYPSFHLRLGNLDKVYFSSIVFENFPLYSGGGYFDMGAGFHPSSKLHLWLGLNVGGPFDSGGLLGKMDIKLNQHWQLNSRARWGSAAGVDEWGLAAGLTYNLISKK